MTEKVLGTNCCNLAFKPGYRPNPSSHRQLACRALDELRVRPTHVRREVNHHSVFHHDQHGVSIAHFDLVAHGVRSRLTFRMRYSRHHETLESRLVALAAVSSMRLVRCLLEHRKEFLPLLLRNVG